jgi:hypothetical protein
LGLIGAAKVFAHVRDGLIARTPERDPESVGFAVRVANDRTFRPRATQVTAVTLVQW